MFGKSEILPIQLAIRDISMSTMTTSPPWSYIQKLVLKVKPSNSDMVSLISLCVKYSNEYAMMDILYACCFHLSFPPGIKDRLTIVNKSKKNTETLANIFQIDSDDEYEYTIFHFLIEKVGWNQCFLRLVEFNLFISKLYHLEGLVDTDTRSYCGYLFDLNAYGSTPMQLACENGHPPFAIMSSLIDLSKKNNDFNSLIYEDSDGISLNEDKSILRLLFPNDQSQMHFVKLIAEYADNEESEVGFLMSSMMNINPKILTLYHNESDNDSCLLAIHWACYYQHQSLVEYCLQHSPFPYGGMLVPTSQVENNQSSSPHTPKTALDYLIITLGCLDDQFSWKCLDSCINTLPRLALLETIIENINCTTIRDVLLEKLVINQIISRYNIDFAVGNLLVSGIRIANEWELSGEDNQRMFHTFCTFLLQHTTDNILMTGNNTLEYLALKPILGENDIQRLPLHVALDHNLKWTNGLSLILFANPFALEAVDPSTGLMPFMLAAATGRMAKSKSSQKKDDGKFLPDLNTVFELLRHRPALLHQENLRDIL